MDMALPGPLGPIQGWICLVEVVCDRDMGVEAM